MNILDDMGVSKLLENNIFILEVNYSFNSFNIKGKDALNWSKVTVKTFIVLQKISIKQIQFIELFENEQNIFETLKEIIKNIYIYCIWSKII